MRAPGPPFANLHPHVPAPALAAGPPVHGPAAAAPPALHAAADPRHRDAHPAGRAQLALPHEMVAGGGDAARLFSPPRPLPGRGAAAGGEPQRRAVLSGQPALLPGLHLLGLQRPLLAASAARPVCLLLAGPRLDLEPSGLLGGGGLLD